MFQPAYAKPVMSSEQDAFAAMAAMYFTKNLTAAAATAAVTTALTARKTTVATAHKSAPLE